MELLKGIHAVDLAIYVQEYRTLIISDLHIGYEEALRKQGILIPKFHFRDLVKRLENIFAQLSREKKDVEAIIINGDLKHEFGSISEEEWRNTLKLLDWLIRKSGKLILVKGNHDKTLGPIAEKRSVQLAESVLLGETMIVHGDREVEVPQTVKNIIIGHDHPAITITDGVRAETYKCFLVGKHIDLCYVLPGCIMREVDRLGDGVVRKPLKCCLHLDVPLGGYVVGGDE